jgi:uncharacterized protein
MQMGSPVVHFELAGPDHEATAKFYCDLFGWSVIRSVPELVYTTVDTNAGSGINGGIGSPPNTPPYVTVYTVVPDLQATLDKAESLGGKTMMGITEVPNVVTMAMFSDPAGNIFGIIKDEGGDAVVPSQGDGAPVDWFEILGSDGEGLKSFYGELFGWSFEQYPGETPYWTIDTGAGRGSGGGVGASQDGQAQLNVYAHVDDVQKYVERAEAAGATTTVPPTQVSDTLTIAHIAEPNGTRFALYMGE